MLRCGKIPVSFIFGLARPDRHKSHRQAAKRHRDADFTVDPYRFLAKLEAFVLRDFCVRFCISFCLATIVALLPVSAHAQTEPDFGDDSSRYAEDNECDDPRFAGPGAATFQSSRNEGHDATDCERAFANGTVRLRNETPVRHEGIDFGTDSSRWALNDLCDDPRFRGRGMATFTQDRNILADSSDCLAAFQVGTIALRTQFDEPHTYDGINFGVDSSEWANDDECDDPRFLGAGMAQYLTDDNIEADASDCLFFYRNGTIDYIRKIDAPYSQEGIVFGIDEGSFANDGECDDPRFVGLDMSVAGGFNDAIENDASDCLSGFEAGRLFLRRAYTSPRMVDGINFGDDSSPYANDAECDDSRFVGEGMTMTLLTDSNILADASDCLTAWMAGELAIREPVVEPVKFETITFGTDSSDFANDNECDDPRFDGIGMARPPLLQENIEADATDCLQAYEQGRIVIRNAYFSPVTFEGVDFGDDSGDWSNDGECDDRRFIGEGMTRALLTDEHIRADATDCLEAYRQELLSLREPITTPVDYDGINFGTDTSVFANDNECDDPRFEGEAMAEGEPFDENKKADATDCLQAYQQGRVTYIDRTVAEGTVFENINFGTDDGRWALDGECDDPRFSGSGMSQTILLDTDVRRDATDCLAAFQNGNVQLTNEN